jgi:hypothetical protein
MKSLVRALALTALLITPAFAQKNAPPPEDPVAAAARQRAEEADRAYKNALKNTANTAPAAPTDPWANIRAPALKAK